MNIHFAFQAQRILVRAVRRNRSPRPYLLSIFLLFLCYGSTAICRAQEATGSMLVSIEAKHGKTAPAIEAQDIQVTANGKAVTVRSLEPVGTSPVQLLLLIDDSASFNLGTELNPIKDFIRSLPSNTQVGIGYMRNGMVDYVQQFTPDHDAAANSIRLALGRGGADVSPYDSLSDAAKRWPSAPDVQRREVVLISSGIEELGGGLAPENQYVNKSIADAQRAGVVVFGIYNPNAGHYGHTLWRESVGQNLLSQLCDETGGESYINTFGPAVDFTPYFKAIQQVIANQYRLTIGATPTKAGKKNELVSVKVKVREKDADVASPSAIALLP